MRKGSPNVVQKLSNVSQTQKDYMDSKDRTITAYSTERGESTINSEQSPKNSIEQQLNKILFDTSNLRGRVSPCETKVITRPELRVYIDLNEKEQLDTIEANISKSDNKIPSSLLNENNPITNNTINNYYAQQNGDDRKYFFTSINHQITQGRLASTSSAAASIAFKRFKSKKKQNPDIINRLITIIVTITIIKRVKEDYISQFQGWEERIETKISIITFPYIEYKKSKKLMKHPIRSTSRTSVEYSYTDTNDKERPYSPGALLQKLLYDADMLKRITRKNEKRRNKRMRLKLGKEKRLVKKTVIRTIKVKKIRMVKKKRIIVETIQEEDETEWDEQKNKEVKYEEYEIPEEYEEEIQQEEVIEVEEDQEDIVDSEGNKIDEDSDDRKINQQQSTEPQYSIEELIARDRAAKTIQGFIRRILARRKWKKNIAIVMKSIYNTYVQIHYFRYWRFKFVKYKKQMSLISKIIVRKHYLIVLRAVIDRWIQVAGPRILLKRTFNSVRVKRFMLRRQCTRLFIYWAAWAEYRRNIRQRAIMYFRQEEGFIPVLQSKWANVPFLDILRKKYFHKDIIERVLMRFQFVRVIPPIFARWIIFVVQRRSRIEARKMGQKNQQKHIFYAWKKCVQHLIRLRRRKMAEQAEEEEDHLDELMIDLAKFETTMQGKRDARMKDVDAFIREMNRIQNASLELELNSQIRKSNNPQSLQQLFASPNDGTINEIGVSIIPTEEQGQSSKEEEEEDRRWLQEQRRKEIIQKILKNQQYLIKGKEDIKDKNIKGINMSIFGFEDEEEDEDEIKLRRRLELREQKKLERKMELLDFGDEEEEKTKKRRTKLKDLKSQFSPTYTTAPQLPYADELAKIQNEIFQTNSPFELQNEQQQNNQQKEDKPHKILSQSGSLTPMQPPVLSKLAKSQFNIPYFTTLSPANQLKQQLQEQQEQQQQQLEKNRKNKHVKDAVEDSIDEQAEIIQHFYDPSAPTGEKRYKLLNMQEDYENELNQQEEKIQYQQEMENKQLLEQFDNQQINQKGIDNQYLIGAQKLGGKKGRRVSLLSQKSMEKQYLSASIGTLRSTSGKSVQQQSIKGSQQQLIKSKPEKKQLNEIMKEKANQAHSEQPDEQDSTKTNTQGSIDSKKKQQLRSSTDQHPKQTSKSSIQKQQQTKKGQEQQQQTKQDHQQTLRSQQTPNPKQGQSIQSSRSIKSVSNQSAKLSKTQLSAINESRKRLSLQDTYGSSILQQTLPMPIISAPQQVENPIVIPNEPTDLILEDSVLEKKAMKKLNKAIQSPSMNWDEIMLTMKKLSIVKSTEDEKRMISKIHERENNNQKQEQMEQINRKKEKQLESQQSGLVSIETTSLKDKFPRNSSSVLRQASLATVFHNQQRDQNTSLPPLSAKQGQQSTNKPQKYSSLLNQMQLNNSKWKLVSNTVAAANEFGNTQTAQQEQNEQMRLVRERLFNQFSGQKQQLGNLMNVVKKIKTQQQDQEQQIDEEEEDLIYDDSNSPRYDDEQGSDEYQDQNYGSQYQFDDYNYQNQSNQDQE
ncbi:MAG: hypothetical protein EZS28_004237 [Streblomastix strix]|uniref:IQ calmodulin-binding motif family protein n=1 Tax=Streblomastix strix TaxID=222440 RepID=A0A5J4X0A4_9EUKA|nr:MAG: hypothetical protein EZS28_004237 [Streblomastix strix]